MNCQDPIVEPFCQGNCTTAGKNLKKMFSKPKFYCEVSKIYKSHGSDFVDTSGHSNTERGDKISLFFFVVLIKLRS